MNFNLYKTTEFNNDINDLLNEFLICDIIKSHKFYISGSTVLNIIKEQKSKSDLDLYINAHNMSNKTLGNMILNIILLGYLPKNDNFDLIQYFNNIKVNNSIMELNEINYDNEILPNNKNTLKKYKNEIYDVLTNFKNNLTKYNKLPYYLIVNYLVEKIEKSYTTNTNNKDLKYFSLNKYMNCIIRLYHPELKKEIDIIFMKKKVNMKQLIMETFDFDIIKNFITYKNNQFITYYFKKDIKTTDIAKISISHFINRISSNFHEFNNFITRYFKYSRKNYNIYISSQLITNKWIKQLLNLVYMNINIKIKNIHKVSSKNRYKRVPPSRNTQHRYFYIEDDSIHLPAFDTDNNNDSEFAIELFLYNPINSFMSQNINFNLNKKFSIKLKLESSRMFINEYYSNNDFQKKQINNLIMGHLFQNEINNIKESVSKDEDFLIFFKTFTLIPMKLEDINNTKIYKAIQNTINSCCICLLDNQKTFNIYCGNNHKLCQKCIINMHKNSNNNCPLCRKPMFNV